MEQACTRDTDGQPSGAPGQWTQCAGFRCDETGTQTRTVSICQTASPSTKPKSKPVGHRWTTQRCTRSGGLQCAGVCRRCDETGTQTRTVSICSNGVAEEQACTRDTDGQPSGAPGQWMRLVLPTHAMRPGRRRAPSLFAQTASPSTKPKSKPVHATPMDNPAVHQVNGLGVLVLPTHAMRPGRRRAPSLSAQRRRRRPSRRASLYTRHRWTVVTGQWTQCAGFADACDETGTQTRTVSICPNGVAVDQTEEQACTRDTDGQPAVPGQWKCAGFCRRMR